MRCGRRAGAVVEVCGVVCGGVWARLAAHPRRRVHREESVGVASVQRVPAAMGGWWGGSENCAPSCVELRGELRRIAQNCTGVRDGGVRVVEDLEHAGHVLPRQHDRHIAEVDVVT